MLLRSRIGRALIATLLIVGGTEVLPAPSDRGAAAVEPAAPSGIAALGDSFIAGIGAGSSLVAEGCRRSRMSYPRLLADRWRIPLIDRSCPGATVLETAAQSRGLSGSARVVLLQVGGNDMGFVDVAGACFIASMATCRSAIASARSRLPAMRMRLAALARDLRARLPAATVVLLGYPRLLGEPLACTALLEPRRTRLVNGLQRSLDRHLRLAARGSGVVFVDWPRRVDRHSLCSDDPWFVTFGSATRLDDLLHPTAEATRAMAAHLARRLSTPGN